MPTLPEELDLISMPKLFTNEHIPIEKRIVKIHLFSYQTDWFFCEYDSFVKNLFGMVVKNGDFENATWGYFTMPELEKISMEITQIHWNKDFIPREVQDLRPLRVEFDGKIRIYS